MTQPRSASRGTFRLTDARAVVEAYVRGWNERGESTRRELIEVTFAPDGVYADPDGTIEGRENLLADIEEFHERRPGARIEVRSGIDVVADRWFRFAWAVVDPAGNVLRDGDDFGALDGDGRIATIVGFFGPFPRR